MFSPKSSSDPAGFYDFTANDIDGNPVSLEQYRGNVLLLVNVASKCGFTYQYKSLEALYRQYKDTGLIVLGFPSNDFLRQEPGSNDAIKEFCLKKYNVSFPLFAKISVGGRKVHPLYGYLTSKSTNPEYGGRITWNFNKFLINRKGAIIGRFGSKQNPDDPDVVVAIEDALGRED